jgi:hypothetical protein
MWNSDYDKASKLKRAVMKKYKDKDLEDAIPGRWFQTSRESATLSRLPVFQPLRKPLMKRAGE